MSDLTAQEVANTVVNDLNIASVQALITPAQLKKDLPLSDQARNSVVNGRQTVRDILDGKDKRLFFFF